LSNSCLKSQNSTKSSSNELSNKDISKEIKSINKSYMSKAGLQQLITINTKLNNELNHDLTKMNKKLTKVKEIVKNIDPNNQISPTLAKNDRKLKKLIGGIQNEYNLKDAFTIYKDRSIFDKIKISKISKNIKKEVIKTSNNKNLEYQKTPIKDKKSRKYDSDVKYDVLKKKKKEEFFKKIYKSYKYFENFYNKYSQEFNKFNQKENKGILFNQPTTPKDIHDKDNISLTAADVYSSLMFNLSNSDDKSCKLYSNYSGMVKHEFDSSLMKNDFYQKGHEEYNHIDQDDLLGVKDVCESLISVNTNFSENSIGFNLGKDMFKKYKF